MRTIETADAPAAIGAYSQAKTDGDLLFTSGQIPLTPDGELLDDEEVAVQTEQSLENIKAILNSEGVGMDNVLKMNVYLSDIDDFEEFNEVYAGFFDDSVPARSAMEVGALPKDVDIEIEAVAKL